MSWKVKFSFVGGSGWGTGPPLSKFSRSAPGMGTQAQKISFIHDCKYIIFLLWVLIACETDEVMFFYSHCAQIKILCNLIALFCYLNYNHSSNFYETPNTLAHWQRKEIISCVKRKLSFSCFVIWFTYCWAFLVPSPFQILTYSNTDLVSKIVLLFDWWMFSCCRDPFW